jgi:FKBP12-rapamycin complex-associated protein
MESMVHEDGPDDGHRNFSVSRRLNRIEVEAVANGKKKKKKK